MKAVADLLNLFIASAYIAQLGIGWVPMPSSLFHIRSLFRSLSLVFHDLQVVGDRENSRNTICLNICNVLVALIVNHTL